MTPDEIAQIRELEDELADATNLIQRLGYLLTGVVNAIKGAPPELTTWSYHDAPELAREQAARLAAAEKGAARYRWMRERIEVREMKNMLGDSAPAMRVIAGCAYFHARSQPPNSRAADLDAAIDTAIEQEAGRD